MPGIRSRCCSPGTASGELQALVTLPPGISHVADWPSGWWISGANWSVLMYTDGLIEGKVAAEAGSGWAVTA